MLLLDFYPVSPLRVAAVACKHKADMSQRALLSVEMVLGSLFTLPHMKSPFNPPNPACPPTFPDQGCPFFSLCVFVSVCLFVCGSVCVSYLLVCLCVYPCVCLCVHLCDCLCGCFCVCICRSVTAVLFLTELLWWPGGH